MATVRNAVSHNDESQGKAMMRLLVVSTLAIGLSLPSLVADAANLRHERRHNFQARPTVQHFQTRPTVQRPVRLPLVGRRQQAPAFGERWMDDGAIFGHPDDHE
jgi:hypothetical protein